MTSDELPVWPSLDVVAYHVEKQLDIQWQQWDLVDGRLRLVVGFVGAAFAAEIGFAGADFDLGAAAAVLLGIANVALLVAVILTTLGFLPRDFARPPDPRFLRDNYLMVSDADTKRDVLDTMVSAHEANAARIRDKAKTFVYAVVSAAAAVSALGAAVIVEVVD